MDFLSYQIRKLPYGVLKKLADQLDVLDSTRNWKSLISVMPHIDSYTPLQVILKVKPIQIAKSQIIDI